MTHTNIYNAKYPYITSSLQMNLRKMRQDKELNEQEYGETSLILERIKISNGDYSSLSINKLLRLGMLFFKNDPQLLPNNKAVQTLKAKIKKNKSATGAPENRT